MGGARLLSASLAENVTSVVRSTVAGAIQAAVLDEDVSGLRNGIETMVGPRGIRLSGGQRLRVAAARALTGTPQLLLIDDISSGLDHDTEAEFWRRLERAARHGGSYARE